MNQVWDANKKQLHGMRQLGALQAKEKKKIKNNPTHPAKGRDAAVKNSKIGSCRKPPRCIHY